jgi:hypothetical protein
MLQGYATVSLLSLAGTTTNSAGSVIDLAGYADIAKRNQKLIVFCNGVTGTSPTTVLAVTECATTNGTFTAVGGDTLPTLTTNATAEYHVKVNQRYAKAALTAVGGTSPTFNIGVALVTLKRSA